MKLFLVRNKDHKYLCIQYNHLIYWGKEEDASIYHSEYDANQAGQYVIDRGELDGEQSLSIIPLRTYHIEDLTRHLVIGASDGKNETLLQVHPRIKDRCTDDFILYCRRIGTNDEADGIVRGGYH